MAAWLGLGAALGTAQAQPAPAGESQALVKRQVELRETPSDGARSLGTLAAQSPVVRSGQRQGGWVQVRTAQGAAGWVAIFDVMPAAAAGTSGSSATGALRGLGGLLGGGNSTTTATSLSGVRGLTSEDIANAQPDLGALAQADSLRVDAGTARQFAAAAPLAARPVDPLPEPQRTGNSTGAPRETP